MYWGCLGSRVCVLGVGGGVLGMSGERGVCVGGESVCVCVGGEGRCVYWGCLGSGMCVLEMEGGGGGGGELMKTIILSVALLIILKICQAPI